MGTTKCNAIAATNEFQIGTAEVFAPHAEAVTSFPYSFLATDFVALWEVESVPASINGARLRWQSLDQKTVQYFRVIEVVACDFPAVHVDLRIEREFDTAAKIEGHRGEIITELGELAKPIFSQNDPIVPVPIEWLFEQGKRDARRELLRRELNDLAFMQREIEEGNAMQQD